MWVLVAECRAHAIGFTAGAADACGFGSLHHWAISAACVNTGSARGVGSRHTAPASHPLTVPQGQIVFLAQCGDSLLPSGSPTEARQGVSLIPVHLSDDLCGTVSIGDRVLATGCGRYYGGSGGMAGPQAGQVPLTLGVKVSRPRCWQSWVLGAGCWVLAELGAGFRSDGGACGVATNSALDL